MKSKNIPCPHLWAIGCDKISKPFGIEKSKSIKLLIESETFKEQAELFSVWYKNLLG